MAVKSIIVIGSGFAGLSAATFMAKAGWKVTVIEKNSNPGGRAGQLKESGFIFDKGPSFYWMPDVFEKYFAHFGKKVSDYYSLQRLNPSYRVYWEDGYTDIPAGIHELKRTFESIEKGSGILLEKYLADAAYKYDAGINRFVYKPGKSIAEFFVPEMIKGVFRMNIFSSIQKQIQKKFKSPRLRQLLEFPALFLGALPENTPALYSLMNYADIHGGTWYPKGGMYAVVEGMYLLAQELGVQFYFDERAEEIIVDKGMAKKIKTNKNVFNADVIISGADYHFTETKLLQKKYRSYSEKYWSNRVMAPSCLLYYVGLNKKLRNLSHHSLFFDVPFALHGQEIYSEPRWPTNPLFYISAASVTDSSVAPPGCENLVFLIPIAAGLGDDSDSVRDHYFKLILKRMEKHFGEPVENFVAYKRTYSVSDFVSEYNSFKGNAYGLANTFRQTAFLKPSCRSKKIKNLFYTGQLTVPGPGVPPSLISGEVVSTEVIKAFR
ncbi:MAG: phytoene desaturase [Bacteroidetes bacterium]|nr:phytoene desaturase [Bacteroidota bacterium]MBS1930845.1 phytoene desaturase [Bacteroidota bacterium]